MGTRTATTIGVTASIKVSEWVIGCCNPVDDAAIRVAVRLAGYRGNQAFSANRMRIAVLWTSARAALARGVVGRWAEVTTDS